jgi:hypothetical protein
VFKVTLPASIKDEDPGDVGKAAVAVFVDTGTVIPETVVYETEVTAASTP